ncbi:MAG: hypothetical protein ACXVPU_11185, partial [Bacteroidia bacterium]
MNNNSVEDLLSKLNIFEQANSLAIEQDIISLDKILKIKNSIIKEDLPSDAPLGKFSSFKDDPSPYGKLICKYDFNFEERLVLILSLVIHVQPKIVDLLKKESMPTSFGGIIG